MRLQVVFFMTCDNPVVTVGPDADGKAFVGIGFGWKNVEIIFPLNKRACLRLCRTARQKTIELSERKVHQTNDLMMHVADQYLFGPQGYRRISRLFGERGSKVKYGENAFMPTPQAPRS